MNIPDIQDIQDNEEINLILAGDIGYPDQQTYSDFIKSVSELYDNVFLIAGNHEYYSKHSKKDIQTIKDSINEICGQYSNVHFLDNDMILHNDVYIIGSTLWTYLAENDPARKNPINDYNYIKDFTIETSNKLFKESREFLEKSIAKSEMEGKKCIVITHHIPSHSLIDPIYKGGEINSYFASNCDDIIRSPVVLWAYGHTHLKASHRMNNVELLCNPKGYPSEYSRYSKTLCIRI